MWILFKLYADWEKQKRLHWMFRNPVREWFSRRIIDGSVMTYHFDRGGNGQRRWLYLAVHVLTLDDSMNESTQERIPSEVMAQVPSEITDTVQSVSRAFGLDPSFDSQLPESVDHVEPLYYVQFAINAKARERAGLGKAYENVRNDAMRDIEGLAEGTHRAIIFLGQIESGNWPVRNGAELRRYVQSFPDRSERVVHGFFNSIGMFNRQETAVYWHPVESEADRAVEKLYLRENQQLDELRSRPSRFSGEE